MNDKAIKIQEDSNLYSLRQRYLFVSFIIVLLIFAFAWMAQSYVSKSSAQHRQGTEQHHQIRQYNRQLQFEVLQIEKGLEDFMWTPSEKLRDMVHHHIDRALHHYDLLRRYEWSIHNKMEKQLGDFAPDLKSLHTTIDRVMDLRLEKDTENPMLEEVEQKVTAASSHLTHLSQELRHSSYTVSLQLETSLELWQQLHHKYNGYLNDKTSENVSGKSLFELHQTEALYKQLHKMLEGLSTHPQITAHPKHEQRLNELTEVLSLWHLSYEVLKLGRDTSSWRGDILFLKHTLAPQFAHLREYLGKLDVTIDNYYRNDIISLGEVANTTAKVVWLLSLLGLVVISVAYLYFQRTVLQPIATIAAALKTDAEGEQEAPLPEVHNLETRHLIEAYDEMRHQVQDRQQALEHIAMHDSLTALPNRYQLMGTLQAMCETFRSEGAVFAVMMLGLDRFKEVNDTLGQKTGDDILKKFGQRLRILLRDHDNVARYASDEFAVVLHHTNKEEALYVARKIRNEMDLPFELDDINLSVSCSIGIALFPDHGQNSQELTRRANIAMAIAKQHKTGVATYEERYDTTSVERISLAGKLRQAIQSDALHLCYQAQYSAHNKKLSGLEVLCRWEDDEQGPINTDEFIPVAEQTGQIHDLTRWVIKTAIQQAMQWLGRGLDFGVLSINISAFNLHAPNFISMLEKQLKLWDFPVAKLMLEVTESAMMVDPEHAIKTMRKLHELGVKLSIDDYGTGFSSLAYVKQLPVHELKIDKSFVMDMTHNENDAVIVRSTIDLAHNLGLKVVAEGVDSQEKADLLEILDCDYLQGFHLGIPVPAQQAEVILPPAAEKGNKVSHIRDFR